MRKSLIIISIFAASASAQAESLWTSKRNAEASMFADRLATSIGDILLVRVDEKTVLSRSVSRSMSSSTNYKAGITNFFYPAAVSSIGEVSGALPSPEFSKTSDDFSGEGSIADTNVFQSKAAVQVVDVMPNGNLMIEGARRITTAGETQYLVLRGIIRRDDVMTDNSVYSYNVVNATVETISEGDLIKNQRQGWMKQLLDTVNIF